MSFMLGFIKKLYMLHYKENIIVILILKYKSCGINKVYTYLCIILISVHVHIKLCCISLILISLLVILHNRLRPFLIYN